MRERTYEEGMGAWRTSCPKLPIWEEANDRKFVAKGDRSGRCVVSVTAAGSAFLDRGNKRAKGVKGSAIRANLTRFTRRAPDRSRSGI